MDKFPMTPAGYTKLEEELKYLRTVERPAISAAISEARDHGDLSENAEYHSAKEKQGFIEGRISELEIKISRAQVIDPTKTTVSHIIFGATVQVVDVDTDEERCLTIVGEEEANIDKGLISIGSPLARALIGKEEGDEVVFNAPGGKQTYEILEVEYKEIKLS